MVDEQDSAASNDASVSSELKPQCDWFRIRDYSSVDEFHFEACQHAANHEGRHKSHYLPEHHPGIWITGDYEVQEATDRKDPK